MRLTAKQISKNDKKINLSKDKTIVIIDVMGDKTLETNEQLSNIYCVDNQYNVIWQVKEIKTTPPFLDDGFVYLNQNDNGEIRAGRFSGFEYKINPETGEAEQIGFHK